MPSRWPAGRPPPRRSPCGAGGRSSPSPRARGKGLGRALVRGLLAQAVAAGHHDVFLRVHPDNGTALRCYRAAGFLPVDPAPAETWNTTQPVDHVRLRHDPEASDA
ncbi:N-acetyltransferase family protein [Streptomyces virginiae]